MTRIALLSAFLLMNVVALAQYHTPEQHCSDFFGKLPAGSQEAFQSLFNSNPNFVDFNRDRYEDMQKSVGEQTKHLGELFSHELLKKEKQGESLIRLTYLAKYQRGPAVVYFTWYTGREDWQIIDFKIDSRGYAIQQLFAK